MKRALVIVALVGCGGDIDPPWELDHDRIVAVRATPPGIMPGEQAALDALLAFKGGSTVEQAPEAAAVVSPMVLAGFVAPDNGAWIVTYPPEPMLAAARMELHLAEGAPVPLQVGVVYGQTTLAGLKTVWLGKTLTNPTLSEMTIDGEALDGKAELAVPRLTDVHFSVSAIPDDDVNWLTNIGEMHDYDLPASYLRVEKDEEMTTGEFVLVKRDIDGGVAWRVWPIRVE